MPANQPTLHAPSLERMIIGHRGLPSQAPENTLASFEAIAECGTQWIETDVDIIADGTPIILHDSTLDRTTDKTGSLYALTQKDLEGIDAGHWFDERFKGERIPTLRQLIDFINTRKLNLNLEIKPNEQGADQSIALINAIIAELRHLDADRQVIISSFSQPILMTFHETAPAYATAVLFEKNTLGDDWLSVLEFCGATYIHAQDDGLTKEQIEAFTQAGYGVNVWTVNDIERAKELFNWGCTGVCTDIADKMKEAMV